MSNDLVVGSIRSTANPPLIGGIYEALLEKAERERDEVRVSLDRLATIASEAFGPFPVQSAEENLTAIESGIHGLRMDNDMLERERDEAREESLEQARLLGISGSREARLITERDEAMEDAKAADQHRRLAEKLAETAISECKRYKQALEDLLSSTEKFANSHVPTNQSLDFIKQISRQIKKKLNNL